MEADLEFEEARTEPELEPDLEEEEELFELELEELFPPEEPRPPPPPPFLRRRILMELDSESTCESDSEGSLVVSRSPWAGLADERRRARALGINMKCNLRSESVSMGRYSRKCPGIEFVRKVSSL